MRRRKRIRQSISFGERWEGCGVVYKLSGGDAREGYQLYSSMRTLMKGIIELCRGTTSEGGIMWTCCASVRLALAH